MWVGPIVSTPLSYGWSLTRFGRFVWMKLLRTSGTIGKMMATTRKIAIGPKDSSIDQAPDFDKWGGAPDGRSGRRGAEGAERGSCTTGERSRTGLVYHAPQMSRPRPPEWRAYGQIVAPPRP